MAYRRRSVKKSDIRKILNFSQGEVKAFLLGIGLAGIGLQFIEDHSAPKMPILLEGQVQPCFTPSKKCQGMILHHLQSAQEKILMQAYSFTDPEITAALIEAKKRGVEVKIILDKVNKNDPHAQLHLLKRGKIPIRIDTRPEIAHSKVFIIDSKKVITGSYNFTKAAYKRNAENVLVLCDKNLAKDYTENWTHRWEASQRY